MTRSSPIATTMKRSSPNRTGGNYPQWMKTLEDKYQKLHKKITENTSGHKGNMRFNHQSHGRSTHDVRLSHAILKYRDHPTSKQSVKSNDHSKEGERCMNGSVISTHIENLGLQKNITKQDVQSQCLESNVVNRLGHNVHKNEVHCQTNGHIENTLSRNESEFVLETSEKDKATNYSDDSFEGSHGKESGSYAGDDEYVNNDDELNVLYGNGSKVIINSTITTQTNTDKDSDIPGDNKHYRRNLKTSMSRISKVTTKSCPAKIQTQANAGNKKSVQRTQLSRSKSAQKNSKMFTPMSEEAKHAITETIHEMSLTTKHKGVKQNEVKFIPSQGRKCVKTWLVPKRASQNSGRKKPVYDAKAVLESASQYLRDLNDDGRILNRNDDDTTEESCHSSAGSTLEDAQKISSRLPEIQNENTKDHRNSTNQSYRLPGIGKYEIAQRDCTFEITPPGFDSRYNDVQPVEDRESETPPPDIRQLAIDKCSDWLVKYNKGS